VTWPHIHRFGPWRQVVEGLSDTTPSKVYVVIQVRKCQKCNFLQVFTLREYGE
jgi:hypothetical protein